MKFEGLKPFATYRSVAERLPVPDRRSLKFEGLKPFAT